MKCVGRTRVDRFALKDRLGRVRRLPTVGVISALLLLAAPSVRAQQSTASEYEVKATYLYNFARFTEWPARGADVKDKSFAVCVLGHDPFGPILDTVLAGEAIDGKRMVHRRISAVQDAADCRIVFISSSEENRLKETLAALGRMSALTVSDIRDFSIRGGMIQFVLERDKVRFEVNLQTAGKAGLVLSSELLKVAINVRNSESGE